MLTTIIQHTYHQFWETALRKKDIPFKISYHSHEYNDKTDYLIIPLPILHLNHWLDNDNHYQNIYLKIQDLLKDQTSIFNTNIFGTIGYINQKYTQYDDFIEILDVIKLHKRRKNYGHQSFGLQLDKILNQLEQTDELQKFKDEMKFRNKKLVPTNVRHYLK